MRPVTRIFALLAISTVLVVPAAPATAKLQIGISEQNNAMFASKYFKPLHVKYARIVVPWNILQRKDYWPGYLKAWLAGAKRMHVQPHVAFNIVDIVPKYFGKGPTLGQYTKLVKGFRKKYPSVKVFAPWNEENHVFQPTAKHPKLAAQYYKILKRNCRGCTVLAADLLGDKNMKSWVKKFKRSYHGSGPWGIHNYQDGNKPKAFKKTWTYLFTKMVKGPIWSTEAGGLVGFKTVKGRVAYRYSLTRQLKAQKREFALMWDRRVRSRYKRVYIYNWFGTWTKKTRSNRWDSGIVDTKGKPRPAYRDLKLRIKRGH